MSALGDALGCARFVDLTQPLGPATVLWPGSTPFAATTVATHAQDGSYARELGVPEHAGTHLDAPVHFIVGGTHVDELPVDVLVRPVAMLDVREAIAGDPRATVTADAIEALEARDGKLETGTAALFHTGWDAFVDEPERYAGPARDLLFPGLAGSAAEFLVGRGVAGIGIDTLGVDPGDSTTYPVHRRVLGAGLWQLEGLVNLAAVPARGAWVVVAPLRLVAGSGSPARVFAILPAA